MRSDGTTKRDKDRLRRSECSGLRYREREVGGRVETMSEQITRNLYLFETEIQKEEEVNRTLRESRDSLVLTGGLDEDKEEV